MTSNLEDVNLDSKECSVEPSKLSTAAEEELVIEANELSDDADKLETTDTNDVRENKLSSETVDKSQVDMGNSEENTEETPPLPARNTVTDSENPMLIELKGAFPGIEEKYVKAVLIASQGQMDPAFNALLFLSDPEFEKEASIPMQAIAKEGSGRRRLTQLEQDELLARQLDERFNKHGNDNMERHTRERRIKQRQADYSRRYRSDTSRRGAENEQFNDSDDDDVFSNFVDKELPQIRDNLNRNIQETGKKISTWFNGIKKSITDEQDDRGYSENFRSSRRAAGEAPEAPRFNSFGNRYDDAKMDPPSKLENAGISIRNDDLDFESDDDIPPQLPTRDRKVVAQTTFIDTPEPKKNLPSVSLKPQTSPSKPNSKTATTTDELDEMFADTE